MSTGAQAPGRRPVRRGDLEDLLQRVGQRLRRGTPVFLVGQTSQLHEGWIGEGRNMHLAAAPPDRAALGRALEGLHHGVSHRVILESPEDIIPLPEGHEGRARPAAAAGVPSSIHLLHFDPYSVSFRLMARGDEEDYRVVLEFLKRRWVVVSEMNRLLEGLLPRFTNETIQQDPAEFRRKYKGLLQMWRGEQASCQ